METAVSIFLFSVILKRLQPQVEIINCSIVVYINVVDCIVKRNRIPVTCIQLSDKFFGGYRRKHKNANKHICPSAWRWGKCVLLLISTSE